MKLKIIVHEAEEGGYWTEVPTIPGCTVVSGLGADFLRGVLVTLRFALITRHRPRLRD